jgi:hypothetical protein
MHHSRTRDSPDHSSLRTDLDVCPIVQVGHGRVTTESWKIGKAGIVGGKFEGGGHRFSSPGFRGPPGCKAALGSSSPDVYMWPLGVRSTCVPAVPGKTLFEPVPNNWTVPITNARMTANTTTYSPMSPCSSCGQGVWRNSLIFTASHAICHGALRGTDKSHLRLA